ncbi:ATP-binding protein [Phytohabitans sp. ZYX-F-186]|uniref:ATP-binding protein n=1 Tax=Phytohabitans maris TaxID=3071409 RepID=A0ABU0ZHS2_9ACTN|nr:ATP-binding protein [Phytohabitans sp. ZYX-F-186]MDQ7906599.1 ATP-binding protein [Phytohabitans sp. ZYX-F-186]
MLLRFEVSNHRSIMEPVELSMVAVDDDRPAARSYERLNEKVLTVAGVYGPNASGKSNLLDAFAWISVAVRDSLRSWDRRIPRNAFKFAVGPETPSTFEVEMMVDGVRYEYRVELDDEGVVFEGLYSYPERRRRSLFERDGLEVTFRRGLGGLSGTRELLTPTTLALSAAMRLDIPEVEGFGRLLANVGILGGQRHLGGRSWSPWEAMSSTQRLFIDATRGEQLALFGESESEQFGSKSALALLRLADLGIDDVKVVDDLAGSDGDVRPRLWFVHRAAGQELLFDLGEESAGTRTWFGLIGPMLWALRNGQVLLFDEIDASLHPKLSARLLELFQDPEANPYGAQLIFTTHDTSLLNHLNRDEVWLTEKNERGATVLTALAEYGGDKVRRSLNLEKAYLQGRFGAVPQFDQRLLRSVLGLAAGGD